MRTTHGRIHATGVVTAPDEVALGVAGVVDTLGVLVELALGADPVHAPRRRAEAVVINTNRVFTIELPLAVSLSNGSRVVRQDARSVIESYVLAKMGCLPQWKRLDGTRACEHLTPFRLGRPPHPAC